MSEGAARIGNQHGGTPLPMTQSSSVSMKMVLETTGTQSGSTGRKRRELQTQLGILLGRGANRGGARLGRATADGSARFRSSGGAMSSGGGGDLR